MPHRDYEEYVEMAAAAPSQVLRTALVSIARNPHEYSMVPLVDQDILDEMLEDGDAYSPLGVSFVCAQRCTDGFQITLESVAPEDMESLPFNEMCVGLTEPVRGPDFPVSISLFLNRLVEHTPIVGGVTYLSDGEQRAMGALVVPHFMKGEGFDIINATPDYIPGSMDMARRENFSTIVTAAFYRHFFYQYRASISEAA